MKIRRSLIYLALFSGAVAVTGTSISAMGPGLGLPAVSLWGHSFTKNDFSAMCIACHGSNPSQRIAAVNSSWARPYGEPETDYHGSHFVWNAIDGVERKTDPTKLSYEETGVWPTSGGQSHYGDSGAYTDASVGNTGEMHCMSCHSLRKNLLDSGGENKLLLGKWDKTTGDAELCMVCHDAAALGPPNHHPLTGDTVGADSNDASPAGHALNVTHYTHLQNPIRSNSGEIKYYNNGVTCMSCHRAHNAMTSTAARLLRRGNGTLMDLSGLGWGVPPSGSPLPPVNVNYSTGVVKIAVVNGTATGLVRNSDLGVGGRVVTNQDPLCDSCH